MAFPLDGGIGLATSRGDDVLRPVTYLGPVVRSAAQSAWDEYRPLLAQFLRDALGRGDLIYDGVTLYDLEVDLSPELDLTVDRDAEGNLVVGVVTRTNHIGATSTQPTPLGSWADPAFDFYFGLAFTYRIDLPPLTGPVSATGFQSLHVLAPDLRPGNLVADVLFVIDAVWGWLSGTDYVQILEQFLATTDFASYANPPLAPLNAELTRLAGEGYWFLEAAVDRLDGGSSSLRSLSIPGAPGDRLEILLTARGYDTSGVVEGEISWPDDFGQPTSAAAFRLGRLGETLGLSALTAPAITTTALAEGLASGSVLHRLPPDSVAAGAALPATAADRPVVEAAQLRRSAAPARTPLAEKLGGLPAQKAAQVATEVRAGVASRFVTFVGARAFDTLQAEFLRGADDIVVTASIHIDNGTPFGTERAVGRLNALWRTDDAGHGRRHYRLVDLPTEAGLTLHADLAPGFRFSGTSAEVVAEPDGWVGTVTVHKAPEHAVLRDLRASALEQAVHVSVLDQVTLNPQPLPPTPPPELPSGRSGLVGRLRSRFGASAERLGQTMTVQVQGVPTQTTRWDRIQTPASDQLHAAAQALIRQNPSGSGVVAGVDLRFVTYTPPVVR